MSFQNPYKVWKAEWDGMSTSQKAAAATFGLLITAWNPLAPVVYLGVYGIYGSRLNKQECDCEPEADCCTDEGCEKCE